MGQASFGNPYARQKPGGAGAFALAPDHFRDRAIRKAAMAAMPKQPKLKPVEARPEAAPLPASGQMPVEAEFVTEAPAAQRPVAEKKGPLFAGFNLKPRLAAILPAKSPETPPENVPETFRGIFDDDFRRELVGDPPPRRPAGPSLKLVTPDGDVDLEQTVVHGGDRLVLRRGRKGTGQNGPGQNAAARSSSLVLVSSANTMAAAEAVIDADFEEGFAEEKPKKERRVRPGGGGGGGGNGGGGGGIRPPTPQIDRAFNQDDLVSILIVLALLLLFGMFLIRGNGAPAKPEQLASIASVAAKPPEPVGPPPDPYGDKPRVLTPAPVAPAPAPAPAPVPACKAGHTMRAWFCTNESQLTDKAKLELEKELADWNSCFKDRELVVAGYADTRGSTEYNNWLGGQRAKVIAQYLRDKGVKVAQLQPVGELNGLADNENCSNQRRVDISFKGEEAEPSRSCAPPADFAALVCG